MSLLITITLQYKFYIVHVSLVLYKTSESLAQMPKSEWLNPLKQIFGSIDR